jgi:hypothetical protein
VNEISEEARAIARSIPSGAGKERKVLSLRTQKLIVRYGKDAQYPVCRAALRCWQLEAELATRANDGVELEKLLISVEEQKEQARALLDQFYKEGKQKEAIDAAALLRNIKENLKGTQECYQATTKLFKMVRDKMHPAAVTQFERLRANAAAWSAEGSLKLLRKYPNRGTQALRALRRLRKSWKTDASRNLKPGERRILRLLEKIQNKTIKAAWIKDDFVAGWKEAAFVGDRLLSDEHLQGRVTAREIYSHLVDTEGASVAGDKGAKKIRRTAKGLGLHLAEDQRGRKWKPPRPKKQEPKQPRGRPRKAPDSIPVADVDAVQAFQAMSGRTPVKGSESKTKELKAPWELNLREADFERQREIEREIARLKRKQKGSPLSWSSYSKRKQEGKIKGRTEFFANWIDSLAAI